MKFLVSLIDDGGWITEATPEQVEKMVSDMNEYIDGLTEEGVYVAGEGLAPASSAKTLRYGKDGQVVVTDGPFAETKEQLGGFYVFEAKDLDEALELAARIPDAKHGSIEVRPIMAFEG